MRASSFGDDKIKLLCIYTKMAATALYVLQSERADLETTAKVTANPRRGERGWGSQVGADTHRVVELATDPFLDSTGKAQRHGMKSCWRSENKRNVIVLGAETSLPSSTGYQRQQRWTALKGKERKVMDSVNDSKDKERHDLLICSIIVAEDHHKAK